MKHQKLRCLCEGAILLASAEILSFIKLWEMPWGGAVVLSMVPLILFSIRWGIGPGLLLSFCSGCLLFISEGGFAIGWQSILGDYILAFTVIGLAGITKGHRLNWLFGTLIACFTRFLVHYLVGATVWAEYMPDVFMGMEMGSPWIYSLLYNLAYMLPNTVITLIPMAIMAKPLKKYLSCDCRG